MATDYIPAPDDAFAHWLDQFILFATLHASELGITTAQLTAMNNAQALWATGYADFLTALNALRMATQTKDETRAAVEALARTLAGQVQKRPATTNDQRVGLGITVPKAGPTPSPVPSTAPTMQKIDTGTRSILNLFYADSATPTKLAKPAGVQFAEIREQIGGTAPVDPETMPLLAMEGRAPYRADFAPADIGQTVWLALRWVNTRGQAGPWSEIFSAVVPS